MTDKLVSLLADVLGLGPAEINPNTSMDNTPVWDSVMHLNLCLSVEQTYGISLSPEEMIEMRSVPAIEATLARHGVT